ncbi:MAG: asparagine synthetase B family protein [Burkholderiales bacterium]
MLRLSSPDKAVACRTAVVGNAALGWCGWSLPGIARAGHVIAVFDGHIYNRDELGAPENDAALVVALYEKHGFSDALRRINGDFAVALYDGATDTLWLGRDRFGLKPLYYTTAGGSFALASRPRALLALRGVSREVNRRFVALFAASHYRYFDNDPEQSPYQGIAQLPVGHVLRVANGQVTSSRYWSLEDAPEFTAPEPELAEQYGALLQDAVALRLKAAREPAFTLSGGMDSSSVLASAVRASGSRQHAFSAVYDDRTYDESDDIRPMVEAVVKEWHPVRVGTPDVFGLVRRMIEVHDEPVATATWLSHFLLCEQAAKEGFGSLFGGLGGDELNAGEYEHFIYHFADLRAAGLEAELAREAGLWITYHDHPIFRKSVKGMERSLASLVDFSRPGRCLPDYGRVRCYTSALNPEFFDLSGFEPVMDHPFPSYLRNRTYQDIFRETVPCCLRAEDRQATAFGLDHFLPFFDHRLVEHMFRVPGHLKIRNGVTKHLLREAMQGILPEETRTRIKKTGWNAPAHVWFSGPGREPILDLIRSRTFRERGIYNVGEVERLVDEHDRIVSTSALQENHMMFLWQLVNLELWLSSITETPSQ